MFTRNLTVAMTLVALAMPAAVVAQTNDDVEVEIIEVQRARTQMDQARRDLERAARTIAIQNRAVPGAEEIDVRIMGFPGFASQGRIGVSVVNADDGALITDVSPGSGAEAAGLKVADVIRSIDEIDLNAGDGEPTEQLMARLRDVEPGDSVALVVERAGESLSLNVETAESVAAVTAFGGPGQRNFRVATPFEGEGNARYIVERSFDPGANMNFEIFRTLGLASSPWADMELVAVTEGLGRYFDTDEGLLVISAPEANEIDIQDGDVILEISGRTPNSPEHAIRILSSFEIGETVEFSLMRDGRRARVEYAIEDPATP